MIPKKIHLCWFGGGSYPLDIKMCLHTWKRYLPDYEIRLWDYDAAKAIGIKFIDEALENRKWAFAADVVRFYAVWKEGGVYMDSDIFLFRNFDELLSMDSFVGVIEKTTPNDTTYGLQAAFFMGEPGNRFCAEMVEMYRKMEFKDTLSAMYDPVLSHKIVSPHRMLIIAEKVGFKHINEKQILESGATILPTQYLLPNENKWLREDYTIGMHRADGSWRKRKFGRRLEKAIKKYIRVGKYYLNYYIGILQKGRM